MTDDEPTGGDDDDDFEEEMPNTALAPDRKRTGPRPSVFRGTEELVPVAVREPNVQALYGAVFQEEAFPEVGIPLLPPAIGTPLAIPDERMFEALTPVGTAVTGAQIGIAGEEAFAEMIASEEVTTAVQIADIFNETGVIEGDYDGGNPAFTELGWLFGALFAANAVAHLWQTFNANLSPSVGRGPSAGPKLSPVQTSVRGPAHPPQQVKPPVTKVPAAAPPRIPIGTSGGGGIGFQFQSTPGSSDPVVPQEQEEFESVWVRTLNRPIVLGGGQDVD